MKINQNIFCIIDTFIKKSILIDELNELNDQIGRFFITVQKSKEVEVIPINKITRKCIKIVIDDCTYLTYCVDTAEHD